MLLICHAVIGKALLGLMFSFIYLLDDLPQKIQYVKEVRIHMRLRSYTRWLYKRIYKTEVKFWAVLGSWCCRGKNLPTAINMQLFGVVFSAFCGQK